MECEIATVNSTNDEIKIILDRCKTIAIVGLSPNPEKASHKVAVYLQNAGYKIIPIYPKEDIILGEKVYRSLSEVPEKIDMVDMFRKASFATPLLEEIKKRDDVSCFWLQLGLVNNEVGDACKELNLDFVQNKCTKIELANMAS